jgi:hypothetical protein
MPMTEEQWRGLLATQDLNAIRRALDVDQEQLREQLEDAEEQRDRERLAAAKDVVAEIEADLMRMVRAERRARR